jgi:hypothetical protein
VIFFIGLPFHFSTTDYTPRRFSDFAEASIRYLSSPPEGAAPADDTYGAELLYGELDLAHHCYPSVP